MLKAPFRISLYKEKCPNLPLPPQPIITRWGTWLEAAFFYSQHFNTIQSFVTNLPDDAVSIKDCKQVLSKQCLHQQLQFIEINLKKITECIKFLESQNIKVTTAFCKMQTLLNELSNIDAPISEKLKQKISAVISRNPDFKILLEISANTFSKEVLQTKYGNLVPLFEYAPVTSCDVERSFSRFKDILTSKRSSFLEENIQKIIIIQSLRNTHP